MLWSEQVNIIINRLVNSSFWTMFFVANPPPLPKCCSSCGHPPDNIIIYQLPHEAATHTLPDRMDCVQKHGMLEWKTSLDVVCSQGHFSTH